MPFPAILRVSGSRVVVRPVTPADIPDLLEVNGDEEVTRFLPYPTWLSLDDGFAWLGRMESLAQSGSAQQLVVERLADGKVLGGVLLFKHEPGSARVEIGYVFGRQHWRQGFALDALGAVCSHLFHEGGIRRIEAEVNPDNVASCALLQALGFTLEGRLRQRWVGKGRTYDTCIHGCLAHEWKPPRRDRRAGE
jgi:[ribosomal protein S5]-alanine N-acetyltransferase